MLPRLIQGGMGVGVSAWTLAREVSLLGQLGVVSGTALDTILIRRLWDGDPGGHMRRAISAFPSHEIGQAVLARWFRAGGSPASTPAPALGSADDDVTPDDVGSVGEPAGRRFRPAPLIGAGMNPDRQALIVLANFVEVHLAKEGHDGVVGVNYLEKIQFPTLPSLYGALLADVDVVLMGAGIPAEIPDVLHRLAQHLGASLGLDVLGAGDRPFRLTFDPRTIGLGSDVPPLRRPSFLPIVSAATLAKALLRRSPDGIAGFVVEGPVAGGHNAPPRGQLQLNGLGEPVYGVRDDVDLERMKALGLPFWLAGAYASPERFEEALAAGAHGIQVGTVFAFCEESGLDPVLRRRYLERIAQGDGRAFTDPTASPTGFPFKVAALEGTASEQATYDARPRLCDLGYLRRAYVRPDGTLGYRCPSEPVDDHVRKGGDIGDTVGRKCLCNALIATIGLGQVRADGYQEPPMLTAGDDLEPVRRLISPDRPSYRARDVIEWLLPAG